MKKGNALGRFGDLNGSAMLRTHAPEPPRANERHIKGEIVCSPCEALRPPSMRISEWHRMVVGPTEGGLQIWCERCDANVLHVQVQIGQSDATQAPKRGARTAILDVNARPLEASPLDVGAAVSLFEDAARDFAPLAFGALRAACEGRTPLAVWLPAVLAAEAFSSRVAEGRAALDVLQVRLQAEARAQHEASHAGSPVAACPFCAKGAS